MLPLADRFALFSRLKKPLLRALRRHAEACGRRARPGFFHPGFATAEGSTATAHAALKPNVGVQNN